MAQSMFWLASPVDITPGIRGSWQTVYLSAHIPAGATGVIINGIGSTFASGWEMIAREPGSSNNILGLGMGQNWMVLGIDEGLRCVDLFVGNNGLGTMKALLRGYTMSGVTYLQNVVDITASLVAGTWTDVDCSGTVPAGARAIILRVNSGYGVFSVDNAFGARHPDSTDNRIGPIRDAGCHTVIVACNSARHVDLYFQNPAGNSLGTTHTGVGIHGWITDGPTFKNGNAEDVSLPSAGSYQDLPAIFGTKVAVIEAVNNNEKYWLRRDGDSDDNYDEGEIRPRHHWAYVGVSAAGKVEGKIEHTDVDFFVHTITVAGFSKAYVIG